MRIFRYRKTIEQLLRQAGIKDYTRDQLKEFVEYNMDIFSRWNEFSNMKASNETHENEPDYDSTEKRAIIDDEKNFHNLVTEDFTLESNGWVGKEYTQKFEVPDSAINNLQVAENKNIQDLTYDKEQAALSGKPLTPGDQTIEMNYTIQKKLRLNFYVNEDPRNMWKDIPSGEKYKPDNECNILKNDEFQIVSASRRGRSHANKGTARDDHFAMGLHEGWAISIVADGAGSSDHSDIGSKVVCEAVLNSVKKKLSDKAINLDLFFKEREHPKFDNRVKTLLYDIIVSSSHNALVKLSEVSRELEITLNTLSTTLSVAILKRFDFGWFAGTFQIGDGFIASYSNDKMDQLCLIDKGEYHNQTRFITSKDVFQTSESLFSRIHYRIYEYSKPIILMTDGVADGCFDDPEHLESSSDAWQSFWKLIQDEILTAEEPHCAMLEWLNFYKEGEHDDRTLSLILPSK